MTASDGRFHSGRYVASSFRGITLILASSPRSERDSRDASSAESLTPAIRTYSTRILRLGSSGHARIAAIKPGSG